MTPGMPNQRSKHKKRKTLALPEDLEAIIQRAANQETDGDFTAIVVKRLAESFKIKIKK